MTKVDSLVIIARDVPLREVFMETGSLLKVRWIGMHTYCLHYWLGSHNPTTLFLLGD